MSAERRRPLHAMAALTALAAFTTLTTARAQPQMRDTAAAEALYKTARDRLAKGDWAAACPKFEASMSLDPAASTQLNIAKCIEHDGKLASAWAAYKRAIVLNQETPGAERQKALADVANKAIAALEPRLPKLRVDVSGRPSGLRITRDGQELPAATLGEALPIDPGPHEIVVSAAGYSTERRSVVLAEGKTEELVIALKPESAPPAVTGTNLPPGKPGPLQSADPPPDAPGSGSKGAPVWAFIVGGAGIALVGAGIAFRIDGASAESTLDEKCGPERQCDSTTGYDPAEDNARKNRDFGLFVGLSIAGGVALSAAVIGIVLAPSKSTAPAARVTGAPWISSSGGGAALQGVF